MIFCLLLFRDASFKRSFLGFFSTKYLAYLHSLMSCKNTPNVRFFYLTFGV
ncbi:hypothetical protein MGAS10750_Spy0766 [Streptococcus pyogenes MGAS10750]|nr:hypothetical protein MGAS10750_Spy0766 [Streptococcus pyogenes MGAS10750]